MKHKTSDSLLRAVGYSALKILVTGITMLGLFFWMYWLAVVATKSDNSLLWILGIILFIVVTIIMSGLLSVFSKDVFSDVFSNTNITYWSIEKTSSNTYKIEEKKDTNNPGLFFAVFMGVIVGILSIPLFLVSLIRLIFSRELRIVYNRNLDDLLLNVKDKIKYEKKAYLICAIVALIVFIPTTIYTSHIQNVNNIDIFQEFKDPNDTGKEYIKPSLRATEISVESGGVYINGFIVEIKFQFSYAGDVDISSISGIIAIYNSNNTKLLEADCSFERVKNNQTQTLYIECRNSPEIIELYYYSINDVSIYYTSNYIMYTDYKLIQENVTKKIN